MFNITLLSLSLSSVSSISQKMMIPHSTFRYRFQVHNSCFLRFTSTFLQTFSSNHKTSITNTLFQSFLSTPLVFMSDDPIYCYIGDDKNWTAGKPMKNENFTIDNFQTTSSNSHSFFTSKDNCGDILLATCTFHKLQTDGRGGALYVEQECTVMLHECLFNDCHSKDHGGAVFICKVYKNGNVNTGGFDDDEITHLTTQFCCFQDCHILADKDTDTMNEKHGVAMYIAGEVTNLSFLSTVRCPGHERVRHRGAQFDIQSNKEIFSSNINTTGGYSKYCSGIEYRHSPKGVFMYQTVTDMKGKFATSLTSLKIAVEVSYCNYVNNTVEFLDDKDHDYSALIHVRFENTKVTNFYIVNTKYLFNDGKESWCKIVASDSTGDNPITHHQRAIVENCFCDENDSERFVAQIKTNLALGEDFDGETYEIEQLFLGECQGVKKADTLVITPIFTASNNFTFSEYFSESGKFSRSLMFSTSSMFSKTDGFSKTEFFTKTGGFSETDYFSNSKGFSRSDPFERTNMFSKTDEFSKTEFFTKTGEFSKSGLFSESADFTTSMMFTQSDNLKKTGTFTPSKKFTKSDYFSRSTFFSNSAEFSLSQAFTNSHFFSSTIQFTESNFFSETAKFSHSEFFSYSNAFNPSDHFTESDSFKPSSHFTSSDHFTPSDHFTSSDHFTPSDHFTKSSEFTASDRFTGSNEFTLSGQFTGSNIFNATDIVNDRNVNLGGGGSKTNKGAIIGGVVGAVAAIAIIAALVAFFLIKKKKSINLESDVDVMQDQTSSITVDNNLQDIMDQDDPFANEFA